MNQQELLTTWVAALRSGTYQQGQEELRRSYAYSVGDDNYCCLGVLCDISGMGHWVPLSNGEYLYNELGSTNEGTAGTEAPSGVARLAGITYDQDKFVSMNDENELSFNQIADYIETTYLGKDTVTS